MSCAICGKVKLVGAEGMKWAKAGFPLADYEKRVDICRGCSSFSGSTCKECGCLIMVKARMATTKCPLGKW